MQFFEQEYTDGTTKAAWNYGQGNTSVFRSIEPDFFEAYNTGDTEDYIATMHDWSSDSGAAFQQSTMPLHGADFKKPNRYGLLWAAATSKTLGSFTPYFNGVAGSTTTWSQYNCSNTANDYFGRITYSAFSIIDCQQLGLLIGTGLNVPMTIYSVDVWQYNTAKNVYIGTTAPII